MDYQCVVNLKMPRRLSTCRSLLLSTIRWNVNPIEAPAKPAAYISASFGAVAPPKVINLKTISRRMTGRGRVSVMVHVTHLRRGDRMFAQAGGP